MFSHTIRRLQRIGRPPQGLRCFSLNPPAQPLPDNVSLLMKLLDMPSRSEIRNSVGPIQTIEELRYDDIQNSFDLLRSFNIEQSEIRADPKILLKHALTISNNYNVLHEAGFARVRVKDMNHYVLILNKPIENLKCMLLIPKETNVARNLAGFLQIDVDHMEFGESERLRDIRTRLVSEYLYRYFDVDDDECQRIWKAYPTLRHKSLRAMCTSVELLQSELNMSKERIIKHPYLLYSDPENIRKILGEPTLGGINTKELMWRRPKILMSSHSALMKVQQHLRAFEIPDSAVPRCVEIFTLSPDTIYERLVEMRKTNDFSVLVHHPRVLRLVHYHSKARARLEYLRKMKVNCVSLHILSSSAGFFEKYTRTGVDKTNGGDIVLYLSRVFKQPRKELRTKLNRHPNWCHVPVSSVKVTLEFLIERGFSVESIHDNIYLTMYPIKRIEKQLRTLKRSKTKFGVGYDDMTENQILQLCLYLIEVEFHFAGDGIWLHPLQTADCAGTDAPETEAQMLGNYKSSTYRGKRRVCDEAAVTSV